MQEVAIRGELHFRKGIGTHPCTHDEAMEFAALSMIIDYGEFRTDTHKPGFLQDLRSVLPAEYAKIKHIDRLVLPYGYT